MASSGGSTADVRGLVSGAVSAVCGLAAVMVFRLFGGALPYVLVAIGVGCAVYAWRQGARKLAVVGCLACAWAGALLCAMIWDLWSAGELRF